jgi:cytochrome c553
MNGRRLRMTAATSSILLAALAAAAPASPTAPLSRTEQHYILQCQGCHRADGTGNRVNTPPMAGIVARFLAVEGGREYLARVPGVATAALGDADLAALLNWTLLRFDAANVPADFRPYTAAEIGAWRRQPLRTEAPRVRAALVERMNATTP